MPINIPAQKPLEPPATAKRSYLSATLLLKKMNKLRNLLPNSEDWMETTSSPFTGFEMLQSTILQDFLSCLTFPGHTYPCKATRAPSDKERIGNPQKNPTPYSLMPSSLFHKIFDQDRDIFPCDPEDVE